MRPPRVPKPVFRRVPDASELQQVPVDIGAPERIRTSDPQIRSLVLYPAELRALAHGAETFPAVGRRGTAE